MANAMPNDQVMANGKWDNQMADGKSQKANGRLGRLGKAFNPSSWD